LTFGGNFDTVKWNRQTNTVDNIDPSNHKAAPYTAALPSRRIKRQADVEKVSSFRGEVTWTAVAKITPLEPPANLRVLFRHHRRPATRFNVRRFKLHSPGTNTCSNVSTVPSPSATILTSLPLSPSLSHL